MSHKEVGRKEAQKAQETELTLNSYAFPCAFCASLRRFFT